jgi:hypothetical protein
MPKKSTILFDLAHNEMLNINDEDFTEFSELIKNLGIKIKTNENKNIIETLLQNVDILVIGNPINEYFSDIEIKAIVDFVRQGGNLLLISEYGADYLQKTNLNDISGKFFGIYFQKNIVKEYNKDNQNCSSIIYVYKFQKHEINKQLRDIVLGGSCSFLLNKYSEPLFYSEDTWTEIYDDITKEWIKDGDERYHILGAYTEYGRGKAVAIGDIDLFSNDPNIGLNRLDNRKLINNILKWFIEPSKDSDVVGWIVDQLGLLQNEIKEINNKINNLIETSTILEKRLSNLENDPSNKDLKEKQEEKEFS